MPMINIIIHGTNTAFVNAISITIPPRIVVPNFTNKEFLRWRWENYDGI